MTAYQRDDGAEMVEYRPGCTIRRDIGLRLGLIAPEFSLGPFRPAALDAAADPQPEPVDPPPLQPSHDDLATEVPEARRETATRADVDVPPRAREPRPAKRSLSAILAEAERIHRARRRGGRP